MPPIAVKKWRREANMSKAFPMPKTAAELQLARIFAESRGRLPGHGALRERRAQAFRKFQILGLPHRRDEAWKYTDLRKWYTDAKPLAGPPDQAGRARAKKAGATLDEIDCRRLVIVDGVFLPELSDLANLEPGLTVTSMAHSLSKGDGLVTRHVGKTFPVSDAAVELNTALMNDGVVVHVAPGVAIVRPLHFVFVAGQPPAATFLRSLVVVEPGAGIAIVETHEGPAGCGYQANIALELAIGAGAACDHVKIIAEGADAIHISTLMASIGAGARLNDYSLASGGAISRNQVFIRFDGERGGATISGASLLDGKRHADTTVVADHGLGHCESREMFKSVVDDDARAVFQGKIIVRPNAQKTNAKMMSQALLLSDGAEADHKPELEIFADDVQCGHGATTGALNAEFKFYLMARGIPAAEAEALLIEAFLGETLDRIDHANLREAVTDTLAVWLSKRGHK
jgi:Fe-S cluster assembly protein SufD